MPFAQIFEYFVILWSRTSLDMSLQVCRIASEVLEPQTSLNMFVELYQFTSEVLELQYKSYQ